MCACGLFVLFVFAYLSYLFFPSSFFCLTFSSIFDQYTQSNLEGGSTVTVQMLIGVHKCIGATWWIQLKASDILTSTLAAFLFSSHPKKGKGSRGSFKLLR